MSTTTIDSLNIQITTSAANAAQSLDFLATKLERLKSNSKLTTVVNNLEKLKKALNGFTVNSNGVQNIARLSVALTSLNQIPDLKNLRSAINSLNRLPNIIAGLDTNTITRFANRMTLLADALRPLASQMNQVADGFARLPVNLRRAVSATNAMGQATNDLNPALNTKSMNLFTLIQNYETLFHAINAVIQATSRMLSSAIEWDGIQFRFGQSFGEDAEEVYGWIQKINDAMGINIQEFMQYSGLYASLLNGFGLAQEKVTEIAVGLTELSYDIWAFSNDRFKSLEEASEAIRSAITGEIEPIRNAGIALTEASLQEFIDSTHLAGISIEKLTEAQKAEVRYAAMVNSAMSQGIVGTYAREMDTAEGAVRSLSQSFKTLTQALGSLFIPLLKIIVPYVTAFVELVTEAVHKLASLFGIKIQAIDWSKTKKGVGGVAASADDATKGLGSAAKAAKKLRDYTMGFDELNVINPDSGSSGGAGGAGGLGDNGWGEGLDLKSLWDDALLKQASERVDEIKEKIKTFFDDWKWGFAAAGAALTAFAVYKHWETIVGWFTKIKSAVFFVVDTVKALWGAFKGSGAAQSALTHMYPVLSNIYNVVKTVIGFVTKNFTPITAIVAAVASAVYFLYQNWEEVTSAVKDFFKENISPKLEEIKSHFDKTKNSLKPLGDLFEWIGDKVLPILGDVFEWVGGVIFSVVGGVILGAINTLVGVVENAIQAFTGAVSVISGIIQIIVALFKGDFSEIKKIVEDTLIGGVVDLFSGLWGLIYDPIEDFVDGVISWFTNLYDELVGHSIVPDMIDGIVDWFLSLPDKILDPVEEFTEDVLKTFKDLWENTKTWWNTNVQPKFTKDYWLAKFDVLKTAIATKLAEFKAAVIEKWTDLKGWYNTNIAPKLTLNFWLDKFKNLKEGFVQTIKNMVNAGIEMINKFISKINSTLKFEWDGLEIAGQEIYPGGSVQLFTIPKIPKFENGGFIEDGLFTMNRGEIAGKFTNGKSVVANNEQIVAGIAEGVYSAVVAAMNETQRNSDQAVNVYLDGKQIYASVKRTESRRGVDLMGNQLGYVY